MVKNSKDFSKGKIYCIRNNIDDEIYIGSTTQPLSKRFQKHRGSIINCKRQRLLYDKMLEFGKDNFYIELVEEYPCENIEQLNRREGEMIREMKSTLNKQVAGRTINEWREDNKDYLREDKRLYHLQNKDRFNDRSRKWHEDNREKANTYKAKVMECPCGVSYTQSHKSRHLKSKYHQAYEQSLTEDN